MVDLKGRVALVTGASSGAGEGIALALAAAGAGVIVTARRGARLESLVERIAGAGGAACALVADLAAAGEPARVVAEALAWRGRLDVLVNDAGVMLNSPLAEAELPDLERMIALNFTALVATCHAALPVLLRQGAGDIVNVSSIAARLANPTSTVYSATKAAVSTFSEALRREATQSTRGGVRVGVIEPGLIASELGEHIPNPATRERFARMTSAWRPLQPADVGAAVLYMVGQPRHAAVNAIVLRPADQDL